MQRNDYKEKKLFDCEYYVGTTYVLSRIRSVVPLRITKENVQCVNSFHRILDCVSVFLSDNHHCVQQNEGALSPGEMTGSEILLINLDFQNEIED